jgi:hypothetical protein
LVVPIFEASRPHSVTPHSVGLLCTSYQPDSDISTWQYTKITRYRHPWVRRKWKALSVTCSEFVSVALGMQHSIILHRVKSYWPVRLYNIFHFFSSTARCSKDMLLNIERVFGFSL